MIFTRLYPFTDMPFHLAVATIFKYFNHPGNEFSSYYVIPGFIKSNVFHLYFTSLNLFPDVEIGNKIFFILYVIIFPTSVLFLIHKTGGNIWFSLFSFAYIFNHNCSWGFVDFTFSTPIVIIFTAFCYDYFQNNKKIIYPFLFVLIFVIFFMHFQSALFAVLIFTCFVFMNYKQNFKYYLKAILYIIPVLLLMIYVYRLDTQPHHESLIDYLLNYYSGTFFINYFDRLWNIPILDNYHLSEGPFAGSLAVLIFILIIIPVSFIVISKFQKNKFLSNLNKNIFVLLIASIFCYLLLPNDIPGQNMVYQRYTVYILISIIIVISHIDISEKIRKIYYSTSVLILSIYLILVSLYFYDFKKETLEFNQTLFPEPSKGIKLYGLIEENKFKGRPIYIHFPYYYTIWKKGISGGIVDYRFGFIKRKPEITFDILPYYKEWVGDFDDYKNEYINIDYVVARDKKVPQIDSFNVIYNTKNWFLLKNKNLKK